MKTDDQGFLVSDEEDSKLIAEMREDVRKIREAILGKQDHSGAIVHSVDRLHDTIRHQGAQASRINSEAARHDAKQRAVASTPAKRPITPVSRPVRPAVPKAVAQSLPNVARDDRGRFTSGGSQPVSSVTAGGNRIDVSGALSAISSKSQAIGSAIAESDPAMKAMGEVMTPVGKIIGAGHSGTDKLLKRIWKWFKDNRKVDETNGKKERKILRDILNKPNVNKNNFFAGIFGGAGAATLLPKIFGLGGGGKGGKGGVLPGGGKDKGKGKAGGKTGKAGKVGKIGGALKGAAGKLTGLLKKLPLLGALFEFAEGLLDFTSEDEATREKAKKGLIGAGAGAALGIPFGPIGVAIGTVVGKYLGENVEAWLPKIQEKWTQFTDAVSDMIDNHFPSLKRFWEKFKQSFEDVIQWVEEKLKPIKEFLGIAKEKTEQAIETATTFYNDTKQKASETIEKAAEKLEYAKESVSTATEKASSWFKETRFGQWINDLMTWKLGDTSSHFEARGKVGTISSGRGDHGGVSYGVYQMSSNTGTADDYAKKSKYAKFFAGAKAGSAEFNRSWTHLARHDPKGFEADQHDYIKRTHYDPAVAELKKHGISVETAGPAMQDAVWSTANQFGPARAVRMILAATKGGFGSEQEFVTKLQDYKIANNEALFKSSTASNRAGTLRRAHQEKHFLIKLANENPAKGFAESHVGMGAAAIPPAPTVREPLTTQPQKNSSLPKDVGQDVKDRKVAHIVTGGMA